MDLPTQSPVKLNLGAGGKRIEGFLSVDIAGDPDIKANIVCLPFDDESVDEIMAVHVFEHLYRWDAPAALTEWLRVLKSGARLILEMPDIVKCCKAVIDGAPDRMGMWGLYGDPHYKEPYMVHRWGWSQTEIIAELKKAGFRKIKVCTPQFHKKDRDMRLEARK